MHVPVFENIHFLVDRLLFVVLSLLNRDWDEGSLYYELLTQKNKGFICSCLRWSSEGIQLGKSKDFKKIVFCDILTHTYI